MDADRSKGYDRAEEWILRRIMTSPGDQGGTPEKARMQAIVDGLWEAFGGAPYSWCGFYHRADGVDGLVLGPRRAKPACSPIGWQGCCGRAFRENEPVVVADVSSLGDAYIACDPDDRSEVVVPVPGPDGRARAVLDADSHDAGAFTELDAERLSAIVRRFLPADLALRIGPP